MKKAFIILLASLGFVSCVKDEGNYDYVELNQITIEGLEESYNVLDKVDSIKIYPTIKGTLLGDDLSNYEYQWHIHEGIAEHKHTIIGTEKDLEYKVDLGVGTYTLYFTVKDKTTGLEAQTYASVKTATAISKGFLLLGDNVEEGIMGLDMIVMPAGRDTTVAANVYDNSETKYKGAEKILYQGPRMGNETYESLWMCTEDGSFRMSHHPGEITVISEINDYHMIETDYEHKEMRLQDVFPHQTNYYGNYWNCSYSNRGYMTEDMIVFGSIMTAEYYATPCNRMSNADGTPLFEFFPFVFYHEASNNGYTSAYVFYNTTDSCFVKTQSAGTRALHCVTPGYDDATDAFTWNQKGTGRTMVWGGNTLNSSGHSLALMKDEEGKYFLYKFVAGPWSFTKAGCYEIDLTVAPNFAEASHYMASASGAGGSLLMYTYGSTLYLYNYAYKTCESFEMNEEITCIEPEFISEGQGSRTAFFVATYSDENKGTVRKYDAGTNPNTLEIIERPGQVWKTNLRVKDIEWKTN